MSRRETKTALYEQFARMGKGLSNPIRLELLDLLSQGERSVEALAKVAGLAISTASLHLQALRAGGLVLSRKNGNFIHYRLAGEDVGTLLALLREVATKHLAEIDRAAEKYLGENLRAPSATVERADLIQRIKSGEVVVLDVRPTLEYEFGHIPGAVSVPLNELDKFLKTLGKKENVVVYCRGAYCVLAYDAVRTLKKNGHDARRLQEGMLEWRLAGLPVEKGAA